MPFDAGGFYGNEARALGPTGSGIPAAAAPPVGGSVQGSLPWGNAGAGLFGAGNPAALAANYSANFNNALAMNQSNYNNILHGYQQAEASQREAQAGITAGYQNLQGQVLGQVSQLGRTREQAIQDQYKADLGKQSQQLVDRGLGNTTVQSAVARGIGYDRDKSLVANSEWQAGLQAQYMSQLGQANLQSQQYGYGANTALLGRQLDFMNSVQSAYPDAGLYAQLAQTQANNAARFQGPHGYGIGAAQAPPPARIGGAPGLGYNPRPAPSSASGAMDYGGSGGGDSWMMSQRGTTAGGYANPYTNPFAGGYTEGVGAGGDYGYAAYGPGDYGGGGDFGGAAMDFGGGGDF